jgi:hypothetical protein
MILIDVYRKHSQTIVGIIIALWVLLVNVSGNFTAETLGCRTQKLLSNMWFKHFIVFAIIYFSINFTKTDYDNPPIHDIGKAFIVWILYHFFTHMDIFPTIVVSIMFMLIFFISNYRNYYNKQKKETFHLEQTLEKIEIVLFYLSMIIICLGFFKYYLEKKQEYYSHWSFWKFILGVKKCKGLR